MRKLTLVLAAALASFANNVGAEEPVSNQEIADTCGKIGGLARSIMQARQIEVPLSKMMEIAGDNTVLQKITLAAYDEAAMQAPENQKSQIDRFGNEAEAACWADLSKP